MVDSILSALAYLANPTYWVAVVSAVVLAALTGVVPGFSSLLVMALAIPFIIINVSDPIIGVVLLATIAGVDNSLDSIPAVLLGNPSAGNQVTFLEGHQLARKGYAAYTLGGIYAVSAIGGLVGALTLAAIVPIIRPVILRISYPEISALAMFGVGMVSALSRGAMLKGLIAGLFGVLFGTIGIDAVTGTNRFTFGQLALWNGLPLIATTLGLFGLPEMIDLTMTRKPVAPPGSKVTTSEVLRGARDGLKRWPMVIRQSLLGVFLGAIPGVGAAVIDWLAYVVGVFFSKDKSQFGKGSFDGVLFAESAQNSKEAGQAVPTLTLSIPGGLQWALVLAGMLAYNVTPGPAMLSQHADLTIAIILTLAIGNFLVTMIGLAGTGYLARLTLIPYPLIGAIIIPVSIMAAFADINNWLAVAIVLAFTVIGLVMKQYKWPRPPLILGFILGPIIEANFMSAYSIYGMAGFFTRPLTIILFLLAGGIAYFFYRLGRSGGGEIPVPLDMVPDEAADAMGTRPESRGVATQQAVATRLHFRWKQVDNLLALIVIAGAAAFVIGVQQYPAYRAQLFPQWAGIGVIVLTVALLLRNTFQRTTGPAEILDIGMRSGGAEARRIAYILVGLFALFIVMSLVIGLQWALLAYALLAPALTMYGKWRWLGPIVCVTIVYVFMRLVLIELANVRWPGTLFGWF